MYITGLIHRDGLFDVATRWLADRPGEGDGLFVSQVFVFESLVFAPTALRIMRELGALLRPGPYCLERMRSKDAVRRSIVGSFPLPGPRASELFARFRRNPEDFFPRTPVDLVAATCRTGEIVGLTRVKGIQRIADKASRRVADRLFGLIAQTANLLATARARMQGVQLHELVSTEDQMDEEFIEAERAVSLAFRDDEFTFEKQDMRIDDVTAVKFVGTPEKLALLENAICDHSSLTVAEREVHSGRYNDVNLLVDCELPPVSEILDRMRGFDWGFASTRGLDPATCARDFASYVESGARNFRIEVILLTPDELIESEFGRSIHEERVLVQRHTAPYAGRIAMNASYIIQYLILLALSPVVRSDSVPIKMWGRYLPDTLALSLDELFGEGQGRSMFTLFAKHPLEIPGLEI